MAGLVGSYGVGDAERNSAAAPAEARAEPAEARLLRRVGGVLVLVLLAEIALRVRFPWDIMLWAESPFMVNILKLHAGQPIFSPPGDVNSFVYSPGLEHLAYALLAPFGLALDVRWCRAVNVGVGFGAAAVAAFAVTRVAAALGARRRAAFPALLLGSILVVFRNFTADVLHPDNIQMLHAVVTFALAFEAIVRRRFWLALVAVCVAGMGVWTKQVEAGAAAGAAAALILAARWQRRQTLAIVAAGALTTVIAVLGLVHSSSARLYLLDVLVDQAGRSRMNREVLLGLSEPIVFGHRLLLLVLAVEAGRRLLRDGGIIGRTFVIAWACVGATTALPCLSAYLKPMGTWNNFGAIDLWMFMLAGPALVTPALAAPGGQATLRWTLVVALLVSLVPAKLPMSPAHWAYAEELDRRIAADVGAGRRVLLAFGTAPLIHAGVTDVPRDRANSSLELQVGDRYSEIGPMLKRFREGAYDRIYLNSPWYFLAGYAIQERYHEVERIRGVPEQYRGVPLWFRLLIGDAAICGDVTVFDPKGA